MKKDWIIGSRESQLAVCQSQTLVSYLERAFPDGKIALKTMKTTGDKILDKTLDKVGGKGLFVKELDLALQAGEVDLTVHSLKDMPMETPKDLPILACSKREDPRDVLVLPKGAPAGSWPDSSKPIGTSSLRRSLQLKKLYPGYEIIPIRGNLQTRLRKLDEGQVGALVLAAAGLKRLGLGDRISRYFSPEEMIPAAGQGIMAVQGRKGEDVSCLEGYGDAAAWTEALCERAFVRELDGGCTSPVCAHAEALGKSLSLRGLYYDETSGGYRIGRAIGQASRAEELGQALASRLRESMTGHKQEQPAAKGADSQNLAPSSVGKVWLVGAGPGDAGLMTLRGREVLTQADVVVYDALVDPTILAMIPDTARLIFAGKRSGNHFMRQGDTNRVLLQEAQKGLRVVRLKGGDPFLFGRGGEELELLVEHGIPFEVVPGITSALAVPAYNGIPVTHRDFCSSVHIITGHQRESKDYAIDFKPLVETKGTLIFLMGIAALPSICQGLLEAGMDPQTPAAVLERGTTSAQHHILATLSTLEEECEKQHPITPAIIVVGRVCSLADSFGWYEKRPLAGLKVAVTRPKELSSQLSDMLRQKGAQVLELPSIHTQPIPEAPGFAEAVEDLKKKAFDWIVFTSPSGVRIFFEKLFESGDVRMLGGCKIASIGQGTTKALKSYGCRPDFMPSVYDGRTLGAELAELLPEGTHILIPRASIGNPELVQELSKGKNVRITDLATYETVYVSSPAVKERELFEQGEIDFAVFTSASTVKGFAASTQGLDFSKVRAICIGRQTQAAADALGMQTWVAAKATLPSLVEKLEDAAASYGN